MIKMYKRGEEKEEIKEKLTYFVSYLFFNFFLQNGRKNFKILKIFLEVVKNYSRITVSKRRFYFIFI